MARGSDGHAPTIHPMDGSDDNAVCDKCQYPLRGLTVSSATGARTCPECNTQEKVEHLLPERSPREVHILMLSPAAGSAVFTLYAAALDSVLAWIVACFGLMLSLFWMFFAVHAVLHQRVPAKLYARRSILLLLRGWASSIALFTFTAMLGVQIARALRDVSSQ